jgi:hypothetical protein
VLCVKVGIITEPSNLDLDYSYATHRGNNCTSSQAANDIMGLDLILSLAMEDVQFLKMFDIGSNEDGW